MTKVYTFKAFFGNKVVDGKKVKNTDDELGTAIEIPMGEDVAKFLVTNGYEQDKVNNWTGNGVRDKWMGISNTIGEGATTNAKGAVDLRKELEARFGVDGFTMVENTKKVETKKDDTAKIALLKIIASAVNSKAMELASLDKDVQEAVKPYLTATA